MQIGSIVDLGSGRRHFFKGVTEMAVQPSAGGGLSEFFDLIALPKGQSPGEPIQASNGHWFHVLPVGMRVDFNVRQIIDVHRRRRGSRLEDVDRTIALLQEYRAEIAPTE